MWLGKSRKNISVFAGICIVLVIAGLSYASKPGAVGNSTKWTTIWYENFSGPTGTGIDTRYWKYDSGPGSDFGNDEIETMTDSPGNVSLDGAGDLDITAHGSRGTWTSGRIQTTSLYGAAAGRELKVVASIRQPAAADGLGYWPAFWMLGPGNWPQHGEIDIMEDVNALSDTSGALHCGNLLAKNSDGTFGPCHEHTGLSSGMQACVSCQAGYHTYSVVIDRRNPSDEQIDWYLGNREFYTVDEQRVGAQVWNDAVDHGFSIILDLAMGGSYPNGRCGCTSPTSTTSSGGTMSVRYVAVYQR